METTKNLNAKSLLEQIKEFREKENKGDFSGELFITNAFQLEVMLTLFKYEKADKAVILTSRTSYTDNLFYATTTEDLRQCAEYLQSEARQRESEL